MLLVLAVAADRQQASRERTALLAAVAGGEDLLTASENSLLSLVDHAGPILTKADVPAATRRSAPAALGQDAARWEPRVRRERTAVREQRVLPWHAGLRAARDAYAGDRALLGRGEAGLGERR